MKQAIIFTICIAYVAAFTSIPSSRISSYALTDERHDQVDYPLVAFADLAVSLDAIKHEIVSLKRDSLGNYNYVDSHPILDQSSSTDLSLSTNGEWIFVSNQNYQVTTREILRIEANGMFASKTYQINGAQIAWMFDDGSLVSFNSDQILTYNFNGSDWTITHTETSDQLSSSSFLTQKIGSNSIATINQASQDVYQVVILTRQSNGTWIHAETVPIIDTDILGGYFNVLYDGVDTVIFGMGTGYGTDGRIVIKNRNNNWTPIQNITLDTVGIVEYDNVGSFFGQRIQFVDQNTLVATAPHSGYINATAFNGGSVTWFERNVTTGFWTVTKQATSNNYVAFGVGLAVVDKHVLTFEADIHVTNWVEFYGNSSLYLTSAASCTVEPTLVTCHNVTLESCDMLPNSANQLNLTALYTVNTLASCGQVSVQQSGFAIASQSAQVEFTFSRSGVDDVTCTAVITCTSPAPTNGQQPTTSPQSVTTPRPKTSDGSQIGTFAIASALAITSMFAML